jgi:hypothetical protein
MDEKKGCKEDCIFINPIKSSKQFFYDYIKIKFKIILKNFNLFFF